MIDFGTMNVSVMRAVSMYYRGECTGAELAAVLNRHGKETDMIRKVKGELVATCTDCGEEHPGGCQDDFAAFVQEIRDAGWRIGKDGDEWWHRCPACAEGA